MLTPDTHIPSPLPARLPPTSASSVRVWSVISSLGRANGQRSSLESVPLPWLAALCRSTAGVGTYLADARDPAEHGDGLHFGYVVGWLHTPFSTRYWFFSDLQI